MKRSFRSWQPQERYEFLLWKHAAHSSEDGLPWSFSEQFRITLEFLIPANAAPYAPWTYAEHLGEGLSTQLSLFPTLKYWTITLIEDLWDASEWRTVPLDSADAWFVIQSLRWIMNHYPASRRGRVWFVEFYSRHGMQSFGAFPTTIPRYHWWK